MRTFVSGHRGRFRLVGDRDRRSGGRIRNGDPRVQLFCQRLDDARAEPRLRACRICGNADAVIADEQCPVRTARLVTHDDPALALSGEGVLERVDHQLGDNETEAHGVVGTGYALAGLDSQSELRRIRIIEAPMLRQRSVR